MISWIYGLARRLEGGDGHGCLTVGEIQWTTLYTYDLDLVVYLSLMAYEAILVEN